MRRGNPTVASTSGWSREYRDRILKELDRCGDPVEVAGKNGIEVSQVMKCLARERYIERRRLAGADREEFLEALDRRVRIKLFSALDKAEGSDDPKDQLRLVELCRKLLEGTKTFQRDDKQPATRVHINVDAEKAQFNLEHVGMVELQERAKKLLEKVGGEKVLEAIVDSNGTDRDSGGTGSTREG